MSDIDPSKDQPDKQPLQGAGADHTAPGAGLPPPARRRLVRHTQGRILGGVAQGIAAHLGVSPVLVRIAFILLSFAGGIGILLYLATWVILPDDQANESAGDAVMRRVSEAPVGVKVGLAVVVFLTLGVLSSGRSSVFWALVVIVLGILLFRYDDRSSRQEDAAPAGSPATAPSAPAGGWRAPGGPGFGTPASVEQDWSVSSRWPDAAPALPPRPRSILGQLSVATILLASGAAALLDLAGLVDFTFERFLALAVTIVGLGLIVGTWRGRSHGLIVLGVVIIPILVVVNFMAVPIGYGMGERVHRPTELAAVQDEYRLFLGSSTIDLSGIDFEREPTEVRASVGLGKLQVIVPPDVGVEVVSRVRGGAIDHFGLESQGTGVRLSTVDAGSDTGGRLELDLDAGAGVIRVRRAGEERGLGDATP